MNLLIVALVVLVIILVVGYLGWWYMNPSLARTSLTIGSDKYTYFSPGLYANGGATSYAFVTASNGWNSTTKQYEVLQETPAEALTVFTYGSDDLSALTYTDYSWVGTGMYCLSSVDDHNGITKLHSKFLDTVVAQYGSATVSVSGNSLQSSLPATCVSPVLYPNWPSNVGKSYSLYNNSPPTVAQFATLTCVPPSAS